MADGLKTAKGKQTMYEDEAIICDHCHAEVDRVSSRLGLCDDCVGEYSKEFWADLALEGDN